MIILVTGGAGFIGSALIRHIINCTTHSVVNVDSVIITDILKTPYTSFVSTTPYFSIGTMSTEYNNILDTYSIKDGFGSVELLVGYSTNFKLGFAAHPTSSTKFEFGVTIGTGTTIYGISYDVNGIVSTGPTWTNVESTTIDIQVYALTMIVNAVETKMYSIEVSGVSSTDKVYIMCKSESNASTSVLISNIAVDINYTPSTQYMSTGSVVPYDNTNSIHLMSGDGMMKTMSDITSDADNYIINFTISSTPISNYNFGIQYVDNSITYGLIYNGTIYTINNDNDKIITTDEGSGMYNITVKMTNIDISTNVVGEFYDFTDNNATIITNLTKRPYSFMYTYP